MFSKQASRSIGLGINQYRLRSVREYHSTKPVQSFLGDWFNRKKSNDESPKRPKKDIVKDQDNYEVDSNAKIVILNKENSPKYEKFNPSTHMPDFKINQWKEKIVLPKDIESTYNSDKLLQIMAQVYSRLDKASQNVEQLSKETLKDFKLDDLSYRFKFTKELQKTLGFDISDFVLTKAHDLEILFNEVNAIITARTKNERNPNDIALRPEDFTAPNVYFNQELSDHEQSRKFNKLIDKARQAL